MSKASEREQILNEYGAWVEEKTLGGINTSVEAYLEEVKAEENEHKLVNLEMWAAADAATFHSEARRILGITDEEEIDEH